MPLTDTLTLSGGRTVTVQMPNLYELISQVGNIPSPQQAAILRLLEGSGAVGQAGLQQRYAAMREYTLGLYELAALCLIEPKLRLTGKVEAGEIGPADLSQADLMRIHNEFFWNGPAGPRPAASSGAASSPNDA